MSSSDVDFAELDAAAAKILEIAEQALLRGETEDIPDETVQRLLTAGTRLFANKVEMEERYFSPYTGPEAVTATDVVMTCSDMLQRDLDACQEASLEIEIPFLARGLLHPHLTRCGLRQKI